MSDDFGGQRELTVSRKRHIGGNCSCDGQQVANDDSDGDTLTEEQAEFAGEIIEALPEDADWSAEGVKIVAEGLADDWDGESEALPAAAAAIVAGESGEDAADLLRGDGDDGAANVSTPPSVVTGNDESGEEVPEEQARYLHDGGTPTRGVGVNYAGSRAGGHTRPSESGESDDGDDPIPRVVTADPGDDDAE